MPRLLLSLFFISMLSACGSSSSSTNPDIDGDGVVNKLDAFPQDPRETADTDGDGDGDGDGVGDNSDAFPEDASETLDTDLDGVGDNADAYPNDFNNDGVDDEYSFILGVGDGTGASYHSGVLEVSLSDDETLKAGNSTQVTAYIVNEAVNYQPINNAYTISFISPCVQMGLAELSPITSSPGIETVLYTDKGCGRESGFEDLIIASVEYSGGGIQESLTASSSIKIEASPAPIYDGILDLGLGSSINEFYQDGIAQSGLGEGMELFYLGSTQVWVSVVNKANNNERLTDSINVHFTSTCAQQGLAEFIPSVVEANGFARATYQDKGCGKMDKIIASVGVEDDKGVIVETISTAELEIFVSQRIEVGSIAFSLAQPTVIALKNGGTNTVPEVSILEFQILNQYEYPLIHREREVRFSLSHDSSDAALLNTSAISDPDGLVSVQLQSGYIGGTISVIASTDVLNEDGEVVATVSTQSAPVIMTSGLGIMSGFSLSVSNHNPGAFDWGGNTVEVEARLSNRFLNPVADGTHIFFYATGGYIVSNCITENGACSVTWTSSDPRPIDGVVTITARTQGEGDFQDTNSNGMFDIGERYGIYGELYIDANGNGLYDTTGVYQPTLDINGDGDNSDPDNVNNEFHWNNADYNAPLMNGVIEESNDETGNFIESFFDFNDDLALTDASTKKYQGLACSPGAVEAGHCSELVDISASLRIQMSAYTGAFIEGPFLKTVGGDYDYSQIVECVDGRSESHQIAWRVADSTQRRNHLAMGSRISHQTTNVLVVNENGTGDMPSTPPALTYSVWELMPENSALGLEERKNKYLNERGTLVEMLISKPEADTGDTEYGTINLHVQTLDNVIHLGDTPLKVDLLGNECQAL